MPLKLETKKRECETIEFGKVSLKVPGSIPFETMVEFYDLKNMDAKDIKAQDLKDMSRLTKEILYLENDNGVVDEFVKTLDVDDLVIVITFITEYLSAGKDGKKKDLKADSGNL